MPMDNFDKLKKETNILDRIEQAEFLANSITRRNVETARLSNLSPQLGEVDFRAVDTSGRLRVVMSAYDLFNELGVHAHLAGMDTSGVVQFYLSADDGKIYIAGGSIVLDVSGITFANTSGQLLFKDSTGVYDATHGIGIYAKGDDALVLINRKPGKALEFTMTLTNASTPYVKWYEDPLNTNVAKLEINADTAATRVNIGGNTTPDIELWANAAGTETVFNKNSNDIDFRINGDTKANVFKVDAGLDRAQFGTDHYIETGNGKRVYFNEANLDIDFSVEGDTDGALFYVDASTDRVGIGLAAPTEKLEVAGNIKTSGYLEWIETTAPGAPAANRLRQYVLDDQGKHFVEIEDEDGVVTRVQRDVAIFMAKNTSGATINKGQPVYVSGVTGSFPTIALAKANSSTTMPCAGIAIENGANNAFMRVLGFGRISNFDTSAFSEGALLYVSAATAGALTATAPTAPNITQRVGIVTKSDASTGSILKLDGMADNQSALAAIQNAGWTEVSDTWTYASASTITIPSDGTTVYRRGMKIRFKQGGGYKYFACDALTATLLTVIVSTDYTVANAGITNIAYSFIESPYGFPTKFNFTSTVTYSGGTTNPTSVTVNTAYWRVVNGDFIVTIQATLVRGSGNRQYTIFSVPVTAAAISPIDGMDTITAAGLSMAQACYVQTTSLYYLHTMTQNGDYYINGGFTMQ